MFLFIGTGILLFVPIFYMINGNAKNINLKQKQSLKHILVAILELEFLSEIDFFVGLIISFKPPSAYV